MKNLKIGLWLSISFAVLVIILIGVSLFSLDKIGEIGNQTDKLYDHPYTVSTASLRIQGGIMTIHRNMKDIALAKNQTQIDVIKIDIRDIEKDVYKDFDIIEQAFLGDKND